MSRQLLQTASRLALGVMAGLIPAVNAMRLNVATALRRL